MPNVLSVAAIEQRNPIALVVYVESGYWAFH
jgi:hypothetical protein